MNSCKHCVCLWAAAAHSSRTHTIKHRRREMRLGRLGAAAAPSPPAHEDGPAETCSGPGAALPFRFPEDTHVLSWAAAEGHAVLCPRWLPQSPACPRPRSHPTSSQTHSSMATHSLTFTGPAGQGVDASRQASQGWRRRSALLVCLPCLARPGRRFTSPLSACPSAEEAAGRLLTPSISLPAAWKAPPMVKKG